jgi:hypothetical protein
MAGREADLVQRSNTPPLHHSVKILSALKMPSCSRDTCAYRWLTLRATKLRSRLAAM